MTAFRPFLSLAALLAAAAALPAQQPIPILDHGGKITITRLDNLNSEYRETNLSVTPDGRYLFFQSQRGGMPWSSSRFGTFRGRPRYDGDIWYSRKVGGQWQPAHCLGPNVNTSRGEDEPVVSADGQSIVFQSWKTGWETSGGPYYRAELKGAEWQQPTGLGGGINRFLVEEYYKFNGYATDGVAVSPDGRTFLVACGPEYDEPLDIYISRQKDGQWTYLTRAALSTRHDERSLFLAGDGRTLYFASDGFGGLGGLDILKTTLNDDGSFGPVVNIGEPFNTPRDDYGFIITASGTEAYFVREGDIYFADLREADPAIRPLPTLLISGRVSTPTGDPAEAEVCILELPSLNLVALGRSNALTGEYALAIPKKPGEYTLSFRSPGLPELSRTLTVGDDLRYEEMTIDEQLLPETPPPVPEPTPEPAAPAEETPALAPLVIQFDFDKWNIKPEFTDDLAGLAAYLREHPAAAVYITGHTDDKGADGYNITLGLKRAESVRDYLLGQGVANPVHLDTRGEREPAADNATTAGAYRNRRAVVRVE